MAKIKYSCDFETITDPSDCRIWIWGVCRIGDEDKMEYGNSIEGFIEWCENTHSYGYFHNLRFDGEFIVNHLLHNGWKNDDSGEAYTFNGLVSGMGQWYSLELFFPTKSKKPKKMVFYDSVKKLPMSVAGIAKSYGMEIMKGEIDYHEFRPVGHVPTDEELKYLIHDIQIVAKGLEVQFEQGLTRMTNGSDAMADFKATIGENAFKNYFPVLNLETDSWMRKAYKGGFTWLNPKFSGVDIGQGMVFDVNSLYPAQMLNRLLPVGMPIPFEGKYKEDKKHPLYIQHIFVNFELKEGKIPTIQIKGNTRFGENEYLESSDGIMVDLYLTNIDLELFMDHYHVEDIEYVGGFKFQARKGIFDRFIYKWTLVKTQSEGGIRLLAKLMLNSLYGKFATNPDVTGKFAYLKKDGSTGWRNKNGKYEENEDGEIVWREYEELKEYRDPVYTPMGAFITAWARYTTITAAQKVYPDRLVYCDTDSIHMTGIEIPETLEDIIHDTRIGYWQHESTFKRARYLRQKTYVDDVYGVWVDDGEGGKRFKETTDVSKATGSMLSVKCSGMPDRLKEFVTWDNFRIGLSFEPSEGREGETVVKYEKETNTVKGTGRLMPQRVKGGVVLTEHDFAIKEYVPKGEVLLREMKKAGMLK